MDGPGPTTGGGEDLPHDWDDSYLGTPPWDIGRPQAPFVALAEAGAFAGAVLDLGCGTGEHALLAAAHGLAATGVDIAPRAIALARAKAAERDLDVQFLVHDGLAVADLGTRFGTVLDCGFLHVLGDDQRRVWLAAVRAVLEPGGRCHVLCFSDAVPGDSGPRRFSADELAGVFSEGMEVESVDAATIEATFLDVPVPAWLATARRPT